MVPQPDPKQSAKLDIPLREPNHPEAHFQEEADGWHGYIEWEKYPEKKAQAAKILAQYSFADVRGYIIFMDALDRTG